MIARETEIKTALLTGPNVRQRYTPFLAHKDEFGARIKALLLSCKHDLISVLDTQ